MQVLDIRCRILGVEHPYTINTMRNPVVTYVSSIWKIHKGREHGNSSSGCMQ